MKVAIILCGGLSQRMGTPKAWLPIGAESCLQRIVRILAPVIERTIIVSASNQALPPLIQTVSHVYDEVAGEGPLRALQAGLKALDSPSDLAFVTACDSPFLVPDLVRYLFETIGDSEILIPSIGRQIHPLLAVYRAGVLPRVEELLNAGRFAMKGLLDLCATSYIEGETLRNLDPDLKNFWNLNAPADYEKALKSLASGTA